MILFKTYLALSATDDPKTNVRGLSSSAHTLVLTLLIRLQEPDIHTNTIGKVKEFLNRIVIGLSHNNTVEAGDNFPFVYFSVSPFFLGGNQLRAIKRGRI